MTQPIRLDIPSELTTERLLLRVPRLGDGSLIIDATLASMTELKTWMDWASDEYTVIDSEDWCRRSASKFLIREEAGYLIFHRESDRYMGNITTFVKDWRVPKFEIGYWLATPEVGHGYMTEALLAVTQMTFHAFGARRIEIHTDALNLRSRRVAERAGYLLEGVLKHECRTNEELRDTCIYALAK
jgi:ribosomal-protein-serine acetyltransferase